MLCFYRKMLKFQLILTQWQLLSLGFSCWAQCHGMELEYPLDQLGPAVPAVSPTKSFYSPSQFADGAAWETEKALTLCKIYSAVIKYPCIVKTGLVINPKPSTVSVAVEKINSCPVKTSTTIYLRCLITTLQLLTLSLFLKKGKQSSYVDMSIPWIVKCKGEYCHFFLTITMGERRATLKKSVGDLICIRMKPV